EDDLFVDFEDEDGPGVRDSDLPEPDVMPAGDDEPAPAPRREPERRRALQDEPEEPAERERPRRRMLLDDSDDSDDGDDGRRPRLSGDDGERERPSLTMADVVDDAGSQAPLLHWIAVSGGGVGGGWYYEFAAAKDPVDDFGHMLWDYGGAARVSF